MAGLERREPRIAVWSRTVTVVLLGEAAVDERALARAGDAGDGDEHAERDVDGHVAQVVQRRVLHAQRAGGARTVSFSCRSVEKCGR